MEPADAVLLEQWVGQRDVEAFQALVKRHSAMVFAACRRVLGDPARAEDVTQECFLKLAMGDAKPGAFLGPWLHRMATRRCLDTLRTERRRRAREGRYVAEHPHSVEMRWETLEPFIDEALAELPERMRVPIAAHYLEGLSQEEIAQRLGTPRRTVSYRISQGLERMGARLRSRGVHVSAGVLASGLADLHKETLPPELAAKLSKMALARTARALPRARWSGASAKAYAAGALVAGLVAVAAWVGVTKTLGLQREAAAPLVAASAAKPATELAKRDATPRSEARRLAASAASVVPASNVAPTESPAPSNAPPAKAEPQPCAIAGIVVDESRQPIPNATVQVLFAESGEVINSTTSVLGTKTDGKGLFRIGDIPSKSAFVLNVEAEGFYSQSVTSYRVENGTNLEDQCFVLSKGVTLQGKVLGRDGLPVPGALVLRDSFYSDTYSGAGGNNCAQTDDKGFFQLGYPQEVTAVVRVLTRKWGDAVFEVAVQPGVVVELRIPESARVMGRVTRADGTAATDLRVVAIPMSGHGTSVGYYNAFTSSDGRYDISSLPPDLEYLVRVVDVSSNPMSSKQSLGVLAAGSTTQHDFQLEAPARVRGTVSGEQTGRPQRGAHIGWVRDNEGNNYSATTDKDGAYEMEFFTPGTYRIYPFPASGEWHEDFAQRYGRSVTLTLGTEQTIDFRLPDAFSLGIRVLDGQGKPVENASVNAHFSPEPRHDTAFANGLTDATGRFRFDGFRAGYEAWLTAQSPEQNLAPNGGGYGAQFVEASRVVGEAGVDYPEETVVLYGSSGLSGVALGPDGQPLTNCWIGFGLSSPGIAIDGARIGELSTSRDVQTDASGAFTLFEGVPATALTVTGRAQAEDERMLLCDVGSVDCQAGLVTDLGRLVFEAEPATK